jgi:hypothetical protein
MSEVMDARPLALAGTPDPDLPGQLPEKAYPGASGPTEYGDNGGWMA